MIGINSDLIATIQSVLSGIHVVNAADATLLGSPIGDTGSITVAIDTKIAVLKCLREKLYYLTCQDVYLLLRHSLAIPTIAVLKCICGHSLNDFSVGLLHIIFGFWHYKYEFKIYTWILEVTSNINDVHVDDRLDHQYSIPSLLVQNTYNWSHRFSSLIQQPLPQPESNKNT